MPINDKSRYEELARKWMEGTITDDEAGEYALWYNQPEDTPLELPFSFAANQQQQRERMLKKIRRGMRPVIALRTRVIRIAAAAAVLVLLAGAGYIYYSGSRKQSWPAAKVASPSFRNDVLPGISKAVLTLADGRQVTLDSVAGGMVAKQGDVRIMNAGGQLSYHPDADGKETLLYNTLTTRKGQQYPLTLSDGTKVWLNAGSSLRFPVIFSGVERRVQLSGEAYFEVAADVQKAFHVSVNNTDIQVLGTTFDLNGYGDEDKTRTTLLSGAVRINNQVTLKPGQQSRVDAAGLIRVVDDADTEGEVAWKNGQFHFRKMDISTLLKQVERWYDVEVIYEGPKTTDLFTGDLPRTSTLTELLTILQYANVHFRLEGQRLTVLP